MNQKTITVDLDSFKLEVEQGFGSGVPVVRIDILRGGKCVSVHIDLFQHELKYYPTLRMTAVNKKSDVTRTFQIIPWQEI